MNGPAGRALEIDLGFLGKGRYDALVVRDKATVERRSMTATMPLPVALRPAGGFIARLKPEHRTGDSEPGTLNENSER